MRYGLLLLFLAAVTEVYSLQLAASNMNTTDLGAIRLGSSLSQTTMVTMTATSVIESIGSTVSDYAGSYDDKGSMSCTVGTCYTGVKSYAGTLLNCVATTPCILDQDEPMCNEETEGCLSCPSDVPACVTNSKNKQLEYLCSSQATNMTVTYSDLIKARHDPTAQSVTTTSSLSSTITISPTLSTVPLSSMALHRSAASASTTMASGTSAIASSSVLFSSAVQIIEETLEPDWKKYEGAIIAFAAIGGICVIAFITILILWCRGRRITRYGDSVERPPAPWRISSIFRMIRRGLPFSQRRIALDDSSSAASQENSHQLSSLIEAAGESRPRARSHVSESITIINHSRNPQASAEGFALDPRGSYVDRAPSGNSDSEESPGVEERPETPEEPRVLRVANADVEVSAESRPGPPAVPNDDLREERRVEFIPSLENS